MSIMKLILLIPILFAFSFSIPKESPKDFEYRLNDIARNFRQAIASLNSCSNQKMQTEYLVSEIADAINNTNEYSPVEIASLRELKKEAEALEVYIACIGTCGEDITSINNFFLANQRVGGVIKSIVKNKYCVDIISVSLGNYVVYLAQNNSEINYKITYKWKSQNGQINGEGNMGLSKKSVRYILCNRERPDQTNIIFPSILCKEIPSAF